MVSLHKSYGDETLAIKSFEETYKSAYSHGFEAIYALENVDIRSVRPLHEAPAEKAKIKSLQLPIILEEEPSQLDMDYGPGFREWIEPFFLSEPIQVLGLSKHAEKCLLDHQKVLLKDLLGYDLRKLVFLKGMGQGHIDEIKGKLQSYVEGKEVARAKNIDFASWIRTLVSNSTIKKKLFVCLEEYHLAELISLTSVERMEVRRLTPEKRTEWKKEGGEELNTESRCLLFRRQMGLICDAFVKPWLARRLGVATSIEIQERLERMSLYPELATRALHFFSEIYCNSFFSLAHSLHGVGPELYCIDAQTKEAYEIIINRALTYFYKDGLHYNLEQLVGLLSRECAKFWIGFPEGFPEKVLRLSPLFSIRKCDTGKLLVTRAKSTTEGTERREKRRC